MERFRPLVSASTPGPSLERSRLPQVPSLIDERFDHDSCGVGFVASVDAAASHGILTQALTALARLAHRGATAVRPSADSLRSSIWRLRDGRWRMVFHQGTAL